jgi:hypothetical protein
MAITRPTRSAGVRRPGLCLFLLLAWIVPRAVIAQALTGTLIGTVKDAQGGVVPGALVRVSSPALIGGTATQTTNEKGQWRFPALPPGLYALDVELQGFAPFHEKDISVGASATLERTPVLQLAGLAESIAVEGAGSRMEARDPGFGTRFGPEDITRIPTRRVSMFDFIRAAPGISPTSPSSATTTTVSAFGSGTNENQFLIDGTNFTCPCNGIARSEPGIDFIQDVQVQSMGASAEFGNVQGAVINVVTRQGGDRFLYDASYYAQPSGLTSQPVVLPLAAPATGQSGYERNEYRDLTTNLGGPVIRDRLWFFAGYQYLRDYDSQPGADPAFPRTYEQNKVFGKLTWRLTPKLHLMQSVHDEHWVNPEQPTRTRPFDTTLRPHASVPAVTFGNLTHTVSDRTFWDVRVGRFVYTRDDDPSSGDRSTPNHTDSVTGVWSGGPQTFGGLTLIRTTAKATLSHYRTGLVGADHQWKIGGQIERGEHQSPSVIPGGVRFVDSNRQPSQSVSSAPSDYGGMSITASAFASDAVTLGNRLTISAGLRFDHSRAISQDLPALDAEGNETRGVVSGLGTLYTWNVLSPRLGVTTKLSSDGRTVMRASYGRFSQGVLTGEIGLFHPGVAPVTTNAFDPATGGYTRLLSTIDKNTLVLDADTRAPHTNEYSVGVDREMGRRLGAAIAYVHKDGANFIGWTDIGGQYREETQTIGGVMLPVFVLVNDASARRYLLTNQDNYSMTYNGLVMVVEKRRSNGWQAFGSYTLSRTYGLLQSSEKSGTIASGAQVSTVAPPPAPGGVTFGRDPNDLTNAAGRLLGDRPHAFRAIGSVDVPRTGVSVSANLQYFSGKPWAATALVPLAQNNAQRVLLEARGSRRLSSQTLLDLRVSRTIAAGGAGRIELMVDVLNLLNDTAEESLATDVLAASNFGQPSSFIDPRRAMLSVRVNLGR